MTQKKYNNIIYDFENNFIEIAKLYYKKTGKELHFVPAYIAPKLKTVYYCKPIRFCAENPIEDERERICNYIKKEITERAWNLPEHTVVHRITGDGAKKELIAPLWSADKKRVLNYLRKYLDLP